MKRPDIPEGTRIHMVGIGGVGVSALATVLAQIGYSVTGSDLKPGHVMERLGALGITVYEGHRAENVENADLVVASAAIPEDNPELVAARRRGVPIWSRARMLGELMSGNYGIAVAGTHGKTTTTSMLASILRAGGLDPTVLVGGDLGELNGNARVGESDYFVAEACEAFNSFHELYPKIAVVTNIEGDHLEFHRSLQGVIESFEKFLSQVSPDGCVIMCADCPNVRAIIPSIVSRVVTYGLCDDANCYGFNVDVATPRPSFEVMLGARSLGRFTLQVPGEHNVRNALAAIAAANELGADVEAMRRALSNFVGAGRRFETLGTVRGITVIDDYAHHPTEVSVTLKAARAWGRRVVAVFQPHLYSRTQLLASDFAEALKQADSVIVTEIYAAREKPVLGVSGSIISELINADYPSRAVFVPDKNRIAEELLPMLREGDLVLVMGAGDIRASGEELLRRLRES